MSMKVFSGRAHPALAKAACAYLGMPVGLASIATFADGEPNITIGENVRGHDVYVIQPTCANFSANLIELLVMNDALRRASAASITAVLPYFGSARQERKSKPRTPITAKLTTDLIVASGVNRIVAVDLHAGPIQGFTNVPFDHLYAKPVLLPAIAAYLAGNEPACIVSPDAGGVERALSYQRALNANGANASFAMIIKHRERANESEVLGIVGDVAGRRCCIIDDMVDTASTLCKAASTLKAAGATSVAAAATHPVFSGPAADNIAKSVLDEVIVTDTIPMDAAAWARPMATKITIVTMAQLLGEAIRRIYNNESVTNLFI